MSITAESQVRDALDRYRTAAETHGVDVAGYVAVGVGSDVVQDALGSRCTASLTAWFEFCGGVVPGSKVAYVFAGRDLLSVEQASSTKASARVARAVGGKAALLVPLNGDSPIILVDSETGNVIEDDPELGVSVAAMDLAEWIDQQRSLLKFVPRPGTVEFMPICFASTDEGPSKLARHHLGHIIEWFRSNTASEMTISHAPIGTKQGSARLELRQVEAVRVVLRDAGVSLVDEAVVLEDDQDPAGMHCVTVRVR